MDSNRLLNAEVKGSVDFFLDYTNLQPHSLGYGLAADSTRNRDLCSIASVGYALTAWVIAAERGYLTYRAARNITRQTLETLYCAASHYRGFFAHFLDMETGERHKKCEYSTIDTAICLNGVITAAAYFQDREIETQARQLLDRVDWNFLIFERDGQTLFRMAYNPDRHGDYVSGQPGFIYQWDMSAEQKMMYLQAALQVDPVVARKLYSGFSRDIRTYDGLEVIVIPGGHLYSYQCTEAWLDTRLYLDPDGVDWFENTRRAALANRSFCLAHSDRYKTYHARSWGLSSGDSPSGYGVFGSAPSLIEPWHNGTVSIWGALACLPYIPEYTLDLADYIYQHHPQTWGRYGFFDAYNLDVNLPWHSSTLYGIDKGCSMIMIENYLSGLIWDVYTSSPWIQQALAVLGFTRREGVIREQVLPTEWPVLA